MKRLVIDSANLLWRVAASSNKYNAGAEDLAGLAMHQTLITLRMHYNKLKPDQVAISFEGGNNWRKAHTRGLREQQAISKKLYKGNRVKDASMQPFFDLIASFEQLARENTSLVCLSHPQLEGDDVIAAYTRKFSALGDQVTILSDDKDFIQLLQLPGVKLVRPDGTYRGLDKETKEVIDPKFFMYEKAFRGDVGDNVIPAYPKVRSVKLKKAFDELQKGNTYDHSNLMNHTWEFTDTATGEARVLKVEDLYKENIILMDLINGQPEDIQKLMIDTIDHAILNHGKFNMFEFSKFCGKFGLKKIADDVSNFIPLLSSTGINSPLKAETKIIHAEKKRGNTLVF